MFQQARQPGEVAHIMDKTRSSENTGPLPPSPSRSALRSIRSNILIGLMLVSPLGLTVLIVSFLFTSITGLLLPKSVLAQPHAFYFRAIALMIVVCILFLMGLLTRNLVGKYLYKAADRILSRMPLINTIYLSLRQVSETIVSSRKLLLKRAVIVEFPRGGLYSVGFVTNDIPPGALNTMIPGKAGQECVLVCVPTTPNPTTGFLIIVPKSDIIPTDMTIAEAMKMIMSIGAVLPGSRDAVPGSSLLDSVDLWAGEHPND